MNVHQDSVAEVFFCLKDPRETLTLADGKIVAESDPAWIRDFLTHKIPVECIAGNGRTIAVTKNKAGLEVTVTGLNQQLANDLMRAYYRGRTISRRNKRLNIDWPPHYYAQVAGYEPMTPERNFFHAGVVSAGHLDNDMFENNSVALGE